MVTNFAVNSNDEVNKLSDKSYKKKIRNIFKFGSDSNGSEQKSKTKSKSLKSKLKSLWKRHRSESKDESKWLLQQSSSHLCYESNYDFDTKDEKKSNCKTKLKTKDKSNKNKSLGKKIGKYSLQTCKFIGMGTAPGYSYNSSCYYDYETKTYEYYPRYANCEGYSPSMFF